MNIYLFIALNSLLVVSSFFLMILGFRHEKQILAFCRRITKRARRTCCSAVKRLRCRLTVFLLWMNREESRLLQDERSA